MAMFYAEAQYEEFALLNGEEVEMNQLIAMKATLKRILKRLRRRRSSGKIKIIRNEKEVYCHGYRFFNGLAEFAQ
jgi:hypothetical protein